MLLSDNIADVPDYWGAQSTTCSTSWTIRQFDDGVDDLLLFFRLPLGLGYVWLWFWFFG